MEIDISKDIQNKKNTKIMITVFIIIGLFIVLGLLTFLFYPRINLVGNKNIRLKLNQDYIEEGYKANLAFKDITSSVKKNGKVNTNKIGKYEISYSVKSGIFTNKIVRTIEIIDDISPIIELKGNEEAIVCPNKEYAEEGYVATDNYDGDITQKVSVFKNKDELIYEVSDSSKNKTIKKRKLKEEDKEKPVITLNGMSTKYVLLNNQYNEEGVTVNDNCDGNISDKVVISGTVNTKKAGTYTINYSVSDSSNNKSEVTRKVVVYTNKNNSSGINGSIYLTFDDGPSASITPKVLKILKDKGVKATFFVIGRDASLDYLIKQEYNEGHTVGLHSYTHVYKTIYTSADAYFNDLNKISKKVESITGVETKIIRFPGGGSNTVSKKYSKGIMSYLTNEVVSRGYHYFDWNVSSGDAGGAKTKQQVYKNVVNGLDKNRANVVLMHDFENNYKTLNALSDIIDYGLANGYKFLSIDMSTPLVRHSVNN